jgi:transcriptional regulator with XRE-family HTH domain
MRVDDGATIAPLLFIVGGEMPRRRREPGDEAAGALFGERLNSLFATRPDPATGEPYSLRDVSEGTSGVVSRAYLSTLRRGLVSMPGLHIIEALARFFDVPTGYFLGHDTGDVPGGRAPSDDADETDEDAALRLALADPLVRETALRVKDFGPEEWKLMIGMVESQMALRRLAEERARAAGATPPPDPLPPPSSPPPRNISTARRRRPRTDETGGDTTEQG